MERTSVESPAAEAARFWRSQLPRQRRRSSDRVGVALFAASAAGYVLLFLGTFLLPAWWLRLACLLAVPVLLGSLFVIGHDAAHHSLVRSGWLNRLLGRLALMPGYHPFTSWVHAHNTLHHGGTCLKGRHPDFTPFSPEEFSRLPLWRRWLERVYRAPAGVGAAYLLHFYLGYLLFPRGRNRPPYRRAFLLDRLLVLAFLAFQLWAAYALTGLTAGPLPRGARAAVGVGLPWLIWIYVMGTASFVQHTHPRMAWYDNEEEWAFYHVQLCSSTHVLLPWPLGRLLHNIMDHPAHHLDPSIPLYELPASQKLLEEYAPDDSVVVPLTLREYRRICRVCKLYDYRRHCWTDFDGRPTTREGLHTRGAEAP